MVCPFKLLPNKDQKEAEERKHEYSRCDTQCCGLSQRVRNIIIKRTWEHNHPPPQPHSTFVLEEGWLPLRIPVLPGTVASSYWLWERHFFTVGFHSKGFVSQKWVLLCVVKSFGNYCIFLYSATIPRRRTEIPLRLPKHWSRFQIVFESKLPFGGPWFSLFDSTCKWRTKAPVPVPAVAVPGY